MSIELAEKLKKDLTNKYVVVDPSIPELKRFQDLTGHVKTVNMNGRALVQFDGAVDISLYDISPQYLTIVDAPKPKPKAEKSAAPAAKKASKPSAAKKPAGKSPLEMARAQGSTGKTEAPAGEKKLSPLEMARQQGSGGGSKPADVKKEEPKAEAGKKLSPLEMARQQGAGGNAKSSETVEDAPEPAVESAPSESDDDKNLSPLERARKQGAPKK